MKLNNKLIIINIFYLLSIISCQDPKIITCQDGKTKCNSIGGKCIKFDDDDNFFCECNLGFIDDPDNSEIGCSYQQKKQLKAFLLELFLCYGAGHFYIHNYKLAIPKLVLTKIIKFRIFLFFFK